VSDDKSNQVSYYAPGQAPGDLRNDDQLRTVVRFALGAALGNRLTLEPALEVVLKTRSATTDAGEALEALERMITRYANTPEKAAKERDSYELRD
jgi:hypothetical protein